MAEDIYPQITIRVSQFEFKKFKELKDYHNLSARQVLEYISAPCDKCKNTSVIAFDKTTGEAFTISKKILSK